MENDFKIFTVEECEKLMYQSPIELLITDIQHQIDKEQEEEIYKAVVHYIPNVDKEELIRALQYDRGQYEKGYADAMASIVRCKDCKHWNPSGSMAGNTEDDLQPIGGCEWAICCRKANDFCSYGERKDDHE